MRTPAQIVASRIAELRNARNPAMSQEELARRLRDLGFRYDQAALSKLEKGKRSVPLDLLTALAVALDAPLSALLVPSDKKTKVKLGEGVEVTADKFQEWVQLQGPLPDMDPDHFLEVSKGLGLPASVVESLRTSGMEKKRLRLREELKQISKELGRS